MQVPMEEVRADGTLVWRDEGGQRFETPVTAGHCKAQWKADWALRWYALGVDYEMSGKDLIDSVRLSSAICRALGAEPPVNLTYELFLDETGQKISKSKGNGLTIDEWLRYAPPESLSQFMYNQPTRAKRLYFDVIPRAVDEYLQNAERGLATALPEVAANPAWHIHAGHIPPSAHSPLSFQTLLNLAAVSAAETPDDLWAFVRNYAPDTAPGTHPFLNVLVARAVAYCEDFVRPHLKPRVASAEERAGLEDLITRLQNNAGAIDAMPPGAERAKAIQDIIYDAGRRPPFTVPNKDGSLGVGRGWFNALYQVLLGADEGPRFGSVIAAYGIARSISVIQASLAR
jgi:lysyl-tRNA synthetase class 1